MVSGIVRDTRGGGKKVSAKIMALALLLVASFSVLVVLLQKIRLGSDCWNSQLALH